MKRTYQPKKKKRLRKHGFLKRQKTNSGKNILKRKRQKKKTVLTVKTKKKK